MGHVDPDSGQHILARDPRHRVWIDAISKSCGLDRPSLEQAQPFLMTRHGVRTWYFVWLPKDPETGAGTANYGVRVEEEGRKFRCIVRGPNGHVVLEYWYWFPAPDQIITAAQLAGFDWS